MSNVSNILRADTINWRRYLDQTDHGHHVRSAADYEHGYAEWLATDPAAQGAALPWSKTADLVRLRPGELSVWAGYSFHGKSLLLGQVVLSLIAQGKRCCVASFEMKPYSTLDRLARQATINRQRHADDRRAFFAWAKRGLWLYDQQGSVDPAKVIAVIRYCQDELGIEHFVVDSLMKCVRGEDDLNGQKDFVDQLHRVAQDTGVHVHLVAHVKKGQAEDAESRVPTKLGVRGSAAITDQPDNVFMVWADKKKVEQMQAGEIVDQTKPDAILSVEKQRNGSSWFGRIGLWFDPASHQYVERWSGPLTEYVRGQA